MSIRYVWQKFNMISTLDEDSSITPRIELLYSRSGWTISTTVYNSAQASGNSVVPIGMTTITNGGTSGNARVNASGKVVSASGSYYRVSGEISFWREAPNMTADIVVSCSGYRLSATQSKGPSSGYASSSNSAQYPADGSSQNVYVSKRSPLSHSSPAAKSTRMRP